MNNNKLYKKLINETISNLLLEVMNLEDVLMTQKMLFIKQKFLIV